MGSSGLIYSGSGIQTRLGLFQLFVLPVSADHLISSPANGSADGVRIVECPECLETFQHTMKFANGNPLNLALIGHWDGWQPFGSSLRSCGSIEVSIANMKKEDRNHVNEVYVVGFVPSHVVPNVPEALDPFLHPLVDEFAKDSLTDLR